jgi:hypothetical protein
MALDAETIERPPRRRETLRRETVVAAVLIFCLSAAIRVWFVGAVLEQAPSSLHAANAASVGYLTNDSPDYLALAGATGFRDALRRASATGRTLGYPAYLAVFASHPGPVLLCQALLTAAIPVCAFLLTLLLTRSHPLGTAAGVASALSPSGIAIGAMIMSDGLFAALFAAYFVALVAGIQGRSLLWIVFSAGLGAMAMLVRPIFLFDPVVSICVLAVMAANARPFAIKAGATLVAVPLAVLVGFSALNYQVNHEFAFSITGERTFGEYLGAKAEAWAAAGHAPTIDQIRATQARVRARIASLPATQLRNAYDRESLSIAAAHPWATAEALIDDVAENLTSSWHYFGSQLPHVDSRWTGRLERLDAAFRSFLTIVTIIGALSAAALWRTPGRAPTARWLVAIVGMITVFATASGLTFWTGSRILYPVEFLQLGTAAVVVQSVLDARRAKLGRQPAFQAAPS